MSDISIVFVCLIAPVTYAVFLILQRVFGWIDPENDEDEEEGGEENGDEFEPRPIILPDESPREVKCQYCGTKFIERRCPTCNAPRT